MSWLPNGTLGTQQQLQDYQQQLQPQQEALPQVLSGDSAMLNPFTSASAGTFANGTPNNMGGAALQNYLDKQAQGATGALYGGLNSYQQKQPDMNGLLGNFGNRSWMQGNENGLQGSFNPIQSGTANATTQQIQELNKNKQSALDGLLAFAPEYFKTARG